MVAGGDDDSAGPNLDSVYMYNVDSGGWSGAAASMPVTCNSFEMVYIPSSTPIDCTNHQAGSYCSGCDSVGVLDGTTCQIDTGLCGSCVTNACLRSPKYGTSYDRQCREREVMVAGGHIGGGQSSNSVYMYNVYEKTWSSPAAAMPDARRGFGMVHIPSANGIGRGYAMVAGGNGGSGGLGVLDSVYMYVLDAETWSGPNAAMPVARRNFGMVHIPSVDGIGSGQVMVAGGISYGPVLDSVYMYNVDADTWSDPAAAMPVTRYAFGMVHIPSVAGTDRGQVMVASGWNGVNYLDSVYMYDVDADTWSGPAAKIPVARYHFGMVHIPPLNGIGKGQVMVAGGYNDKYLDSVYFSAPVTTTPTTTTTTTTTPIITTKAATTPPPTITTPPSPPPSPANTSNTTSTGGKSLPSSGNGVMVAAILTSVLVVAGVVGLVFWQCKQQQEGALRNPHLPHATTNPTYMVTREGAALTSGGRIMVTDSTGKFSIPMEDDVLATVTVADAGGSVSTPPPIPPPTPRDGTQPDAAVLAKYGYVVDDFISKDADGYVVDDYVPDSNSGGGGGVVGVGDPAVYSTYDASAGAGAAAEYSVPTENDLVVHSAYAVPEAQYAIRKEGAGNGGAAEDDDAYSQPEAQTALRPDAKGAQPGISHA